MFLERFRAMRKVRPLSRVMLEEVLDQQTGCPRGGPATRKRDGNDVEPVIKVRPERLVDHRLLEILVRRGNHADVDLDGPVSADALEAFFLEHPQNLDLQLQRELADLVEEDAPTIRGLEAAQLRADRIGEGALLVAEELAFQERVGESLRSSP
jgi:hypothetical protein